MKIDKTIVNNAVNDFSKWIKHYNETKNIIDLNELKQSDLSYIWSSIFYCKTFDSKNQNCIKTTDGKRLFDLDKNYKLYPDGCNDYHISTMLKEVHKQLLNNLK
jgi:hypothetical protein